MALVDADTSIHKPGAEGRRSERCAHRERDLEAASCGVTAVQKDVIHADELRANVLVVFRLAAVGSN